MTLIVGTVLLGACFVGGALLGRRGRAVNGAHQLPGVVPLPPARAAATVLEVGRARPARRSFHARPVDAFLALVIVVATPVAAWWLIGDLTESSRGGRYQLDYMLPAPEIPGWIVAVLGAIALVATVVGAGFLVHAARRGKLDRRWLSAVGCLALAGVLMAAIGRVFTAGTHGANIGAGLAMFFGAPVVIALVGCALFRGHQIRRS